MQIPILLHAGMPKLVSTKVPILREVRLSAYRAIGA